MIDLELRVPYQAVRLSGCHHLLTVNPILSICLAAFKNTTPEQPCGANLTTSMLISITTEPTDQPFQPRGYSLHWL
jgi:hypothetical protein